MGPIKKQMGAELEMNLILEQTGFTIAIVNMFINLVKE